MASILRCSRGAPASISLVRCFDGVGAGHGIDGVGDAGFVGDDLLRAQSQQRGLLGGQRQGFVEGVGVQRLAAAQHGGQRLDGDAHDVVFRLLRGERGAGGLSVKAQHHATAGLARRSGRA